MLTLLTYGTETTVGLGQNRVEGSDTEMLGLSNESGGHPHGIDYGTPSSKREVQGFSQKMLS